MTTARDIIAAELARHALNIGNRCACGNPVCEDDLALPEWDVHLAAAVVAALRDAGMLTTPGAWTLPAEPGPEVTAVRDRHRRRWTRESDGWIFRQSERLVIRLPWHGLFAQGHAPLTDATKETP